MPSPFLIRADDALRKLAVHNDDLGMRTDCVYAAALARELWPDSPGWYRVSNVGYGSTTGVGPKRAAGGVLKRLIDAGAAVACNGQYHSSDGWVCYGYRPTGVPLRQRTGSV